MKKLITLCGLMLMVIVLSGCATPFVTLQVVKAQPPVAYYHPAPVVVYQPAPVVVQPAEPAPATNSTLVFRVDLATYYNPYPVYYSYPVHHDHNPYDLKWSVYPLEPINGHKKHKRHH